jgi:tetratricopeptide (TPR) repeat protein
MTILSRLQGLFPHSSIGIDSKRNITVKNVDNSVIYINPLDESDLQKLRKEINEDNQTLLAQLLEEFVSSYQLKREIEYKDLTPNSFLPSPPKFINTDNSKLHNLIQRINTPVVITGIGGIGKTTTIQSYYESYKCEYDYSARISFNTSLQNSFIGFNNKDFIKTLNLSKKETNFDEIFIRIKEKLKKLEGSKLLIIDNVNKKLTNTELDFLKSLVRSHNWHILLTSRTIINSFEHYPVEVMDSKSAYQIWNLYYQKKLNENEILHLKEILSMIGFNPLLIELLAKTANNSLSLNLFKIKENLINNGLSSFTTTIQPLNSEYDTNLTDYISTIFDFSDITQVQKEILFQLSALLVAPLTFSDIIFVLQIDINTSSDFENEIIKLSKQGWLNIENDRISMQNSNREVIFYLLNSYIESIHVILDTFGYRIAKVVKEKGISVMFEFVKYIPFIESISNPQLFKIWQKYPETLLSIVNNLAIMYHVIGNTRRANKHYLELLPLIDSFPNENKEFIPAKAGIYTGISTMQRHLCDYVSAKKYILKAEQLIFQLDEYFQEKANVLNNKSLILNSQNKCKQAVDIQLSAIKIREQYLPKNHSDIANSYDNMSIILMNMKNYKDALNYQKLAINIREISIPRHPDLAMSYHRLSEIHEYLSNNTLAIDYEQKSYNLLKSIFENDHKFVQNAIYRLNFLKRKTK